jgi:hypothetical protein
MHDIMTEENIFIVERGMVGVAVDSANSESVNKSTRLLSGAA